LNLFLHILFSYYPWLFKLHFCKGIQIMNNWILLSIEETWHIPQSIDDLLVVSILLEQSKVSLTFLHIERMGEAMGKCVSKSSSRFHFCESI
jgi:hypothetical protein